MTAIDINDPNPDEPTPDTIHKFLLGRWAANDTHPAHQELQEAYDYHTAQDEFDVGRRTYQVMWDAYILALECRRRT